MFTILCARYCWISYCVFNLNPCANRMYVLSFFIHSFSHKKTLVSIQSVLADGDILALPVGAVANNSVYK